MIDVRNFKPAIVYVIYVASTPEKVWQALTSPELSRQYFSCRRAAPAGPRSSPA
jgi:uncharacterized protein YndB with AHSA1/START domain